jgi:hypothetical protein
METKWKGLSLKSKLEIILIYEVSSTSKAEQELSVDLLP